ncbi:MAG: 8-oxo-dGTP diphosphatase [Nitrososphaerota archaeon]|nr:8-oxo-dGTP diphosphatase [Nitrososphaerota archaeon]
MSSDPLQLNPKDTIRAVLCYLKRNNNYLLLLKAAGKFGGGFWNAPGGKIELGESSEEAAVREVREETGLMVSQLERAGSLEFYFGPGKKRPDWVAEVFTSIEFFGTIKESDEGKLEWFPEDKLPLEQMWEDDRHWIPLLIKGVRFRGVFEFTSDSKRLVSYYLEKSGL